MAVISLITLILLSTIPLGVVVVAMISQQANHKRLCLSGMGLVMGGLFVLGLAGEVDIQTPLTFLAEPITFSITHTAILLYLAVLVVLGSMILWDGQDDQAEMMPFHWALVNLSLSFGFISFISGQFMIRYIALDIVGLLAALAVLSTFKATSGLKHFIVIFQILRLGDLSLLAAILLTNHITGTLEISQMIAAAADMRPDARMWVFLGFLLAVLIKLAIWPFGVWLERARQSAPRISLWISGLLVPALGFYLLYRIIPIINSAVFFQNLTFYTALVLLLLTILLTFLHEIRFDRFVHMGSLMSCFLLAAAAFGGGEFLLYYLVGLILQRGLMLLDEGSKSPFLNMLTSLFPLLINGLFIAPNWGTFPLAFSMGWVAITGLVFGWDLTMQRQPMLIKALNINDSNGGDLDDVAYGGFLVKAAGWLNRTLELGILTDGIVQFGNIFHQIADWVYENVELSLEKLWTWIGKKIMAISEGTLQKVEVDASTRTRSLLKDALNSLEVYEYQLKRKPLRWDLAWIPFLLVVILIMLFVL
jgi:hypothetical protein